VILSASCGLSPAAWSSTAARRGDQASTHKPDACLILQRPQEEAALVAGRDHDWAKARDEAIVFARSAYDW
jgi:propionyl-CoA synthetase